MRRLEYKNANSQSGSFCELIIQGDTLWIRDGAIRQIQTKTETRTCASLEEAKAAEEEEIASMLKMGYVEVQVDPAIAAARNADIAKRNLKLERAIFDDPADDAAWQVYGDWLQQHQDPRGELISLELQRASASPDDELELSARIDELMTEHRDAWLGDAAKFVDKADGDTLRVDLRWERGYIVSASVSGGDEKPAANMPTPNEIVCALLESSAALFLRELQFAEKRDRFDHLNMCYAEEMDTLEALTSLTVQDPEDHWCISSGSVLSVAPRLRRLRVCSCIIEVSELEHEVLEEISFESPYLEAVSVHAIASGKLPAAKRLEIDFGGGEMDMTRYKEKQRPKRPLFTSAGLLPPLELGNSEPERSERVNEMDPLRPLFTNEGLPKLEHLALVNTRFQDKIAIEIATSPLLKQLRTLNLSQGKICETGAQAIIEHADNFAHLERLDLSGNDIHDWLCAELKAALPNVELELGGQRELKDWEDPEDWYYDSDSE